MSSLGTYVQHDLLTLQKPVACRSDWDQLNPGLGLCNKLPQQTDPVKASTGSPTTLPQPHLSVQ